MLRNSIPNLFTLFNLYFGFLSIMYSALGEYKNAAVLILIGMMLDSMDGRMARLLGSDSELGKQLDSLADVITFGAAPAMMAYYSYFSEFGVLGRVIVGFFPLFGAYRLARFNIQSGKTSSHYFVGIPIPAGGGLLTLLCLLQGKIPSFVLPLAFAVICVLMVSKIRIPSLKDVPLPKYGIIVTAYLGYALYVVFKEKHEEFPYFIYIAIPLYIIFIGYHFFKKNKAEEV
nr:CDP-diacylglycerol--serine O-phosphatidyltransferase [Peribacillus kribbensis]